jgi:crotonobetainyl-CoA:carnitine CoA-transferase CaiB-like acyl-CoA transferase
MHFFSEGAELCLRMMEKVDVVIENFRPGTMSRLGLGYEVACARNPRIVYCSISGYGQNGPSRDEPAMDLILQASSGLMSVTGTADGQRVRCGATPAPAKKKTIAVLSFTLVICSASGKGSH